MKSFLFVPFLIAISSTVFAEPLQIEVGAESAILMNADTGAILFEKNACSLQYPASTTKIATALYALHMKHDQLDTVIVVDEDSLTPTTHDAKKKVQYTSPNYWLETDGTHMGLKKEEELPLHDLLRGLMIVSGNDAANVIARWVGGTIPKFMEEMNAYLKNLGCSHTFFTNPHGLHHPKHQSTAYDLAIMTKEALKNPIFCDIVSQTRFLRPKTNKQKETTLLQTNRLLRKGKNYYPLAIGVKTGYHAIAKKNIVAAARSNGRTLIAVLLKNEVRNKMFQDTVKLFDAAFNQPKIHHVFLKKGSQKFKQHIKHTSSIVETYLKEELSFDYYPAEDPKPKCLLYWNLPALPIQKEDKVGELHLVDQNGNVLQKISLFSLNDVALKWPYSWLFAVKHSFKNPLILISVLVIALLSLFLLGRRFTRFSN